MNALRNAVALFLVLVVVSPVQADIILISPDLGEWQDTYSGRGGDPDTTYRAHQNNGSSPELNIGQSGTSGEYIRTLMEFTNLPSLAANESVTSAVLNVTTTSNRGGGYEAFLMTQDWVEGTLFQAATDDRSAPDGATWQTFDGVNPWPGISGFRSFDGFGFNSQTADLSAPIASGVLLGGIGLRQDIAFDPTVVEGWMRGDITNHGFLLRGTSETSGNTILSFAGSDHLDASIRPTLTITTTAVPEPSSMMALGLFVAFACLTRFGRHRKHLPVATGS